MGDEEEGWRVGRGRGKMRRTKSGRKVWKWEVVESGGKWWQVVVGGGKWGTKKRDRKLQEECRMLKSEKRGVSDEEE